MILDESFESYLEMTFSQLCGENFSTALRLKIFSSDTPEYKFSKCIYHEHRILRITMSEDKSFKAIASAGTKSKLIFKHLDYDSIYIVCESIKT